MSAESATVAASVVAAVALLISGALAWKLKTLTEQRAERIAVKKQRHAELRQLYEGIFALFEKAIRHCLEGTDFTLADDFARTNAAIHLAGSDEIITRYGEACALLEQWSELHAKASPKKMQFGDETVTLVQAPNPAEKFQEPAREAYDKLQTKLQNLVALMRWELADGRT